MMNSVGSLNSLTALQQIGPQRLPTTSESSASRAPGAPDFQNLLMKSLDQVNQLEQSAQGAIESSLTTGDLTQAETMLAVKKADLAMRTMLQIRNKVMEAYQEVQQMRM